MIRFNYGLYFLVLRGIGVLNYENKKVSGEAYLLKLVSRLINNPTIFDVGANVGEYSKLTKQSVPAAHLYSFEPHPRTYARLKAVSENHRFIAINAALDATSGDAVLFDYATENGTSHASLHNQVITQFHDSKASSVSVKTRTLDDFMTENGIERVDLLKIDTEGNEYPVLLGGAAAIRNKKVGIIQFEFSQLNIANRNFMKDFYDLLQDYDFYRLIPGYLYPLGKYDAAKYEIFLFQNIVAIHKQLKFHK